MFAQLALLSNLAFATPVVTQGINSRRIAPGTAMTDSGSALKKTVPVVNDALVDGFATIKVIRIGPVEGPLDQAFKNSAYKALNSKSRMQNIGTVNAVAGKAVEMGGKYGSKAAKKAIKAQGGLLANFAANEAGALIEQQSEKAAKDITGVRFDPDESFAMNPVSATMDATAKADAELTATVTRKVKHSNFTKKKKNRNQKGKVIKNKEGKPTYFEAKCIKRSVSTKVVATLKTASGQTLYTDRTTGIQNDSKCQKGSYETDMAAVKGRLKKPFALSKSVAKSAGSKLDGALYPGEKSVRLNVGLTPTIGLGIRRLHDNPALSMCLFEDALKRDPADIGANLGKGALLESHGHYLTAKEHYQKAAVDPEYKTAEKAMVRIETRLIEVDVMARAYGQKPAPKAFPHMEQCPTFDHEGTMNITRNVKLRLNGNIAAEIIEPLWIGESVRIIEDGPKWAKVALLDGTEGYINKKLAFKPKK